MAARTRRVVRSSFLNNRVKLARKPTKRYCIGVGQCHMGDASATNINFQYTKETECKKEPREVCGPESCPLVQGDKVCNTETKTVSNGVGAILAPDRLINTVVVHQIKSTLFPSSLFSNSLTRIAISRLGRSARH